MERISEHDSNLGRFLEAAKWKNMTYNDNKSVFSTRCLPILGYIVEEGEILPDHELPVPNNAKSLNRCKGLFSCYSQWIPGFSDRMRPIDSCKTFPLSSKAIAAFESLKKSIAESVVTAVDEKIPFEVETVLRR